MTEVSIPEGHVVKLITDDELIFNLGSRHGVKEGMYFEVTDPLTENVVDPITGDVLGSIKRRKAQIRVLTVAERMSTAEIYPRRGRAGISASVDLMMGPKPRSGTLTADKWPEGVGVGDPVKYISNQ
jgi:hypothetical protein